MLICLPFRCLMFRLDILFSCGILICVSVPVVYWFWWFLIFVHLSSLIILHHLSFFSSLHLSYFLTPFFFSSSSFSFLPSFSLLLFLPYSLFLCSVSPPFLRLSTLHEMELYFSLKLENHVPISCFNLGKLRLISSFTSSILFNILPPLFLIYFSFLLSICCF